MHPMIEIEKTGANPPLPERPIMPAMRRGFAHRCPACGTGNIFQSFLKVAGTCPSCGEDLHHHRADDAPPYFTILIVGHIIGAGILMLEQAYAPETWVHYAIWMPLLLAMTFWLLPRIKGALVGLQWALRMHGFAGPKAENMESVAERAARLAR